MLFSSLSRKERFWANMAIMLIIAAILVFAGMVWVLFQQKARISGSISTPPTESAVVPSNSFNGLEPAAILDTGDNISTNMAVPVPAPVVSVTNSN